MIDGAPFQVGDMVTVEGILDETGRTDLIGHGGPVVHLDYGCGCGQSYPDDPMIGVRFRPGLVEEFWKEELTLDEAFVAWREHLKRSGPK